MPVGGLFEFTVSFGFTVFLLKVHSKSMLKLLGRINGVDGQQSLCP